MCLIKSLQRLLEATNHHYAAIWNVCALHSSALT